MKDADNGKINMFKSIHHSILFPNVNHVVVYHDITIKEV